MLSAKNAVKDIVRVVAPPLVRNEPIRKWPGWLGRTLGVRVPQSLIPQEPGPTGAANINILCEMIERTRNLEGCIAECGVFTGATTVGMGLYLRERAISKKIYAFDSFEGFDPKSVIEDFKLGGAEDEDRQEHGFNATSLELVSRKIRIQ